MLTRKATNRIRRLAARSTPLAIAPGRSKSSLSLSANFSAQSELNESFGYLRLVVADEKKHDLFFSFFLQAFESILQHVNAWWNDTTIPCELFRGALTYKLIQNDRTFQRVFQTINV